LGEVALLRATLPLPKRT